MPAPPPAPPRPRRARRYRRRRRARSESSGTLPAPRKSSADYRDRPPCSPRRCCRPCRAPWSRSCRHRRSETRRALRCARKCGRAPRPARCRDSWGPPPARPRGAYRRAHVLPVRAGIHGLPHAVADVDRFLDAADVARAHVNDVGLERAMAIEPIDSWRVSSKIGFQVVPPLVLFQMPPPGVPR
jgi:hypothetical protein